MTDMDRFTEQNDLKTTKLPKAVEITRAKIPLSGRFFCVAHGNDWLVRNIYGCVIVYEADSNGGYTGDVCSAVFVWIYVCFAKNGTLGAKKCGYPNKRSKVQEYTGAIVLIMGHLLEIIFLYGLLGRSAQMAKDITVLYMLIVLWNMAVSIKWWRIHREHFSYTGKWYLAVEVVFIFLLGTFLENPRFRLLAVILGGRPVDTPYVVWLFGAAQ